MSKQNQKIEILGTEITISKKKKQTYISLTDIAHHREKGRTDDLIRNWLQNRNTLEFLGIWEQPNNPEFKPVEFDGFRIQTGLNSFTLTPKQWIEKTKAICIISRAGRYGGTFAHMDIALSQSDRLQRLNQIAIQQIQLLTQDISTRKLKGGDDE